MPDAVPLAVLAGAVDPFHIPDPAFVAAVAASLVWPTADRLVAGEIFDPPPAAGAAARSIVLELLAGD